MTDNLRARSATELVDAAIQLFRHNFGPILMVSGIGMVPNLVLTPLLANLQDPATEVGVSGAIMTLIASFFTNLWLTLASAAIIAAAAQAYRGEPVDVGAAISDVLARPGAIIYGAIVKGLALFVGVVMVFVGVFYFYATYFALPTTIVVEKLNGRSGVERARQLASGYRWHALKPLVIVWILYIIFTAAFGLLVRLLLGDENLILNNLVAMLLTVVVYPVISITEMVVYFDIRIRKEAYDVEMMAAKLDAQMT